MKLVGLLPALCLLVCACGSTALGDEETGTTVVTTVATEPAVENCVDIDHPDVFVTTSTSGFVPSETIVVREDGTGGYLSPSGTECFRVAPNKLIELRDALEQADLAHVPHCVGPLEGTRPRPPMMVETDTRTVTYGDVSLSVTEPCAGPPARVQRLFDLLVGLPRS